MEDKATLARATKELKRLQEELIHASAEAEEFSFSINTKIQNEKQVMRNEFEQRKQEVKNNISKKSKEQFDEIVQYINSSSPEVSEVTQILEENNLLDNIYKIMSEEQIEAYVPTSLVQIPKESLKSKIVVLQDYAESIPNGADYTTVFGLFNHVDNLIGGITETSEIKEDTSNAEKEKGASKKKEKDKNKKSSKSEKVSVQDNKTFSRIAPSVLILLFSLILLVKFAAILLFLYSCFAAINFINTYKVKRFLNLYASILESIGYGDNADAMQNSVDNIISQVGTYIESCENECLEEIDNIQYVEDSSRVAVLKENLQKELIAKRARIDRLRDSVDRQSEEVARIQAELERLEQERVKELLTIEQRYLTFDNIQWVESLPEDIYLGKNKKGAPVLFPVIHDNVLFVAQETGYLFDFLKLFVMQLMMKVHPDYVSQTILDYKYMAGNLQQFMNLPQRSISIFMEKDKIDSKLSDFNIDVLARNRNILRSVNSIEEFNTLMKEYDSVGECYVFVHVLGLQQVYDLYTNLLRNGQKVGYYFYIYLTMEEFKELKSEILLDLMKEYYFIGDMAGVGIYPDKRLRMVMSSYLTTK